MQNPRDLLAKLDLPADFNVPPTVPDDLREQLDNYQPQCDSLKLKKHLYALQLQILSTHNATRALNKITDLLDSEKPEVARRAAMTLLKLSHLDTAPDLFPCDPLFDDDDLFADPPPRPRKPKCPPKSPGIAIPAAPAPSIGNRQLAIGNPPPSLTVTLPTPAPSPPIGNRQLPIGNLLTPLLLLIILALLLRPQHSPTAFIPVTPASAQPPLGAPQSPSPTFQPTYTSVANPVSLKRSRTMTLQLKPHRKHPRPTQNSALRTQNSTLRTQNSALGQFLFDHLHKLGVKHAFGVPGDFALPTFAWLEKSPIHSITMTHEPGAGFAADAYSRLNGIGLVCVTYCVGGLNVLNSVAGAYAEKSPVVVVSGAPGRKDREKDPLLHHKVKTFETQRRVYDEVTVASTVLLDEQTAAAEIIRVTNACLKHKRPVYIEVPYDMVDKQIPIPSTQHSELRTQNSDPATLAAALEETRDFLSKAKRPVILAGVELHRHNLIEPVLKFAQALNIPIAADLLSKSVISENHPLYLGVYGGAMSSDLACRDYVESADCVLMLGTFITDMSMGIYTAKLDKSNVILATTEQVRVQYHRYEDIQFPDFLHGLNHLRTQHSELRTFSFKHPTPHQDPTPLTDAELTAPLTMTDLLRIVSLHLNDNCCVISDVGDAIFGAVGIRTARRAEFIAPAYYLSMGFAVPASIGVSMAAPNLRPVVLVGDGAFQMTGTEISTAVRLNLKPIIIILNNDGFGTMRKIRDGAFNVTTRWNYGKICELVGGGQSTTAQTLGQFDGALRAAMGSQTVTVIDAKIPRDDMSPQLKNMTTEMARLRGAK